LTPKCTNRVLCCLQLVSKVKLCAVAPTLCVLLINCPPTKFALNSFDDVTSKKLFAAQLTADFCTFCEKGHVTFNQMARVFCCVCGCFSVLCCAQIDLFQKPRSMDFRVFSLSKQSQHEPLVLWLNIQWCTGGRFEVKNTFDFFTSGRPRCLCCSSDYFSTDRLTKQYLNKLKLFIFHSYCYSWF
jgi:hypothetical protein